MNNPPSTPSKIGLGSISKRRQINLNILSTKECKQPNGKSLVVSEYDEYSEGKGDDGVEHHPDVFLDSPCGTTRNSQTPVSLPAIPPTKVPLSAEKKTAGKTDESDESGEMVFYYRKCEVHRHRTSRETLRACQQRKGGCRFSMFSKTNKSSNTADDDDDGACAGPSYPPRLAKLFNAFRQRS